MVSGLFSAKTVVHLSTAPATASFEHAVAVCTETPTLNRSTTALIARRVCIISSLILRRHHQYVGAVGASDRKDSTPRDAGRMSALGHKQTFRDARGMSALPLKADMGHAKTNVR